jgi:hypothetical protein
MLRPAEASVTVDARVILVEVAERFTWSVHGLRLPSEWNEYIPHDLS